MPKPILALILGSDLRKSKLCGSLMLMSTEHNRDIEERDERLKVYELGFHFVPTLSEDDVTVKFSELKSIVEKLGGEFISEDAPKPTSLAYDVSKTLKGQKKWYKNAYFGWIKFTLVPEEVAVFEKEVKANESILRYLLITTVRESTLVGTMRTSGRNNRSTDASDSDESSSDETAENTALPLENTEATAVSEEGDLQS